MNITRYPNFRQDCESASHGTIRQASFDLNIILNKKKKEEWIIKRSKWMCILSILLISCMIVQPVSAAGRSRGGYKGNSRWGWINAQEETTSEEESTSSSDSNAVITLVEDETTVENGEMLRASTYSLMTADETGNTADATSTTVKYFPVTMYDYDAAIINAATDALDADLAVREGIYFSGGSPDYTREQAYETVAYKVEDEQVIIEDGTYILYCTNTSYYMKNEINSSSHWSTTVLNGTSANSIGSASQWTFNRQNDGTYTIQDSDGNYLTITGGNAANLTTEKNTVSLNVENADDYTITIYDDAGGSNGYLNSLGGTYYGRGYFGGYTSGSSFSVRALTGENKIVSGYEEWNRWDKASGSNAAGDLIYTGLVEETLIDDQIVFNVNEGGIFNDNTTVKSIYEYVGLPFVLEDGVYTFDSDENGAYFADTDGDGDADPQSGTATSTYNLQFNPGVPQAMPTGLSVGDGSTNTWFPYNVARSYSASEVNYHFGMRADLPFSMTANGRVKSTDNESTPIKFTFSGDDDVWVYIDGVLVVDLGGIHNRLDVTIDFAANTVTYKEENSADTDANTGSYNNPDFATTQKLFTDSDGAGLINSTRDAFAAVEDHEMSVFYLERGQGTSNCQIQFNLPMNDNVLVTKDATKSWSSNAADNENEGVSSLTAAEQAIVNNLNFGFTLYKKNADETEFTTVANTNFYLLDSNGAVISINSTDANGHFYLKNGQTAKFITDIPSDGATYYVVEDKTPDGFVTPDYNYGGEAVSGFDYGTGDGVTTHVTTGKEIPEQEIPYDPNSPDVPNKSYEVTVKGSVEANDSVEFICSNFLNAELPNPTAIAYEDIFVIDYGLPVQIDPLANDVFRGDSIEILYVGGADVSLSESEDENGVMQATWTEDDTYDFGIVKLNQVDYAVSENGTVTRDTLTYTLNKQLTEVEELTYIIKVTGARTQGTTGTGLYQYDYAMGKIYIVPATTMYYEENFNDLVSFTGSGWKGSVTEDTFVSPYQEQGVVGTVDDSTYGSDVAYLNDSKDSNGTHYWGDTTNGAIRFTYTFTGTGTSIFARTSKDTGYMQIKLYEGADTNGELLNLTYRDTYYDDTNESSEDSSGILYNIPVYTEADLGYGTYTVVATIAKKGTAAAGGEDGSGHLFYLDGIRVMQPLNKQVNENTGEPLINASHLEKALGAYATDGEANMEVVTLRYKMITDAEESTTPWNFVVMTDTNGEITTADEYVSIGPKEEVYLEKGQSVSFSLKHWQLDGFKIYMGMKAPFGSGSVKVGQNTYALANATDCYFDITNNYSSLVTEHGQIRDENGNLLYKDSDGSQVYETPDGEFKYVEDNSDVPDDIGDLTPVEGNYYVATFTLTATDKIISLTNIKVTGNYEFVIIDNANIDTYEDIIVE